MRGIFLRPAILGAGAEADTLYIALKLPNALRRVFAEGAFAAAFVPLFATKIEQQGSMAARGFAGEALALLVVLLLPLVLLLWVLMPWVIAGLAPGFLKNPSQFADTVALARAALPFLPLISLSALLGGVLNGIGRFAAFAAAPILFNLVQISALCMAAAGWIRPAPGMAWGASLAGLLQLLAMLLVCHRVGILPMLKLPRLTPATRLLLLRLGPGTLGAGALQANVVVNAILASSLPAGAVSCLYYADRLNQLPLGLVGMAIGTALLPALARRLANGDGPGARATLNRAMEGALLLTLPAAAALVILAQPIINVLFHRGAFDSAAVTLTAATLAAYALGLPAAVLCRLLATAHFARQDPWRPVIATLVGITANIALALALRPSFGAAGIALATAAAAWLQGGILAAGLAACGLLRPDGRLWRRGAGMLISMLGMAGCWWCCFAGCRVH